MSDDTFSLQPALDEAADELDACRDALRAAAEALVQSRQDVDDAKAALQRCRDAQAETGRTIERETANASADAGAPNRALVSLERIDYYRAVAARQSETAAALLNDLRRCEAACAWAEQRADIRRREVAAADAAHRALERLKQKKADERVQRAEQAADNEREEAATQLWTRRRRDAT